MKCVIFQPSYIPWRGFFHQVYLADLFIFYDDVQFDKSGWRNRNRIKTHHGLQWLTIPVFSKGVTSQQIPINNIHVDNRQPWYKKHWATLEQSYCKAPYFEHHADWLRPFYAGPVDLLADYTIELAIAISRKLGITHTRFMRSSELQVNGSKTERLIQILSLVGATSYLTGPSASDYLDESMFEAAGIELEYMVYDYPQYPQLYSPYHPQLSILDLMFMTGPQALNYMTGQLQEEHSYGTDPHRLQ